MIVVAVGVGVFWHGRERRLLRASLLSGATTAAVGWVLLNTLQLLTNGFVDPLFVVVGPIMLMVHGTVIAGLVGVGFLVVRRGDRP